MIILQNKSGWIHAQSGTDLKAFDQMIESMRLRGVKVESGKEGERSFRIN